MEATDPAETRRRILKTAAVGMAASTIPGASAANSSEIVGAAELGLDEKLTTLLKEGKTQEAKQLVDKHDIECAITRASVHVDPDRVSSQGVNPQDEWGKSASTFSQLV
jgi:hypothetical protein